jgi:hypothetical protein
MLLSRFTLAGQKRTAQFLSGDLYWLHGRFRWKKSLRTDIKLGTYQRC